MKPEENVINFIKNLKKEDNIALVYHRDTDGLCSGVLMKKVLNTFGLKPKLIVAHLEREDILSKLQQNFDVLIFVDIAIDHLDGNFWSKKQRVLLIDHHPPFKDLSSNNIVHYNNHFYGNGYKPASYLVYKLFSDLLKDYEWISVIGTIADYGYEDCKDLLDKHFSVENKKEMFKTRYGKIAGMITGASFIIGFEKISDILSESKLADIENNKSILKAYEKYEIEVERCKKEFWKNAVNYGNIVFSTFESEFERIQSPVSSMLSTENPDKVIILYYNSGKGIKINGRTNLDYNLGDIFKKAASYAGGQGGGHKPAAGALIPKGKLEDFKKKVIELLNNC